MHSWVVDCTLTNMIHIKTTGNTPKCNMSTESCNKITNYKCKEGKDSKSAFGPYKLWECTICMGMPLTYHKSVFLITGWMKGVPLFDRALLEGARRPLVALWACWETDFKTPLPDSSWRKILETSFRVSRNACFILILFFYLPWAYSTPTISMPCFRLRLQCALIAWLRMQIFTIWFGLACLCFLTGPRFWKWWGGPWTKTSLLAPHCACWSFMNFWWPGRLLIGFWI